MLNPRSVAIATLLPTLAILRMQGVSTRKLGRELLTAHPEACGAMAYASQGVKGLASMQSMRALIQILLAEKREDIALTVDDLRADADSRIRAWQGDLYRIAQHPKTAPHVKVQALRGCLTGEERRAKLLGLDQERGASALEELARGLLERVQTERRFNAPSAAPPKILVAAYPPETLALRGSLPAEARERAAVIDVEVHGGTGCARADATDFAALAKTLGARDDSARGGRGE